MKFDEVYKNLNPAQKEAVDEIDGPLLVIAGPGTGKTQLLGARAANILKQTDTLAQNILCLTFTESGANNMRDRLSRFIGQTAFDVNISTYHTFGSELIRRYPEYFSQLNLQTPIDELTQHQILSEIVDKMSYLNPLKQTRHNLSDLTSTISELKRALLSSSDLRLISESNLNFISKSNIEVAKIFTSWTSMPRNIDKALGYFESLLDTLQKYQDNTSRSDHLSLAQLMIDDLVGAIELSTSEKTKPLTKWKNTWLIKNANNQLILDGEVAAKRTQALADTLDAYQQKLTQDGLYDYDDMILRAIDALETNTDLKYTLQEQYLYILLDEFQDTNKAQARLVNLLCDNPVHEGRPNVMAVGDDDQAIYAFQGAQASNMLDFVSCYRNTKVISLTENYRSQPELISTALNVAQQISDRITPRLGIASKSLIAARKHNEPASLVRRDFLSPPAEYNWVSQKIIELIKDGVKSSQIAVLSPKHRHLEALAVHLNRQNIPVHYEKRENILESKVIHQLLSMAELVLALAQEDEVKANTLWPQVLSFDFWKISIAKIWNISWQVSASDGKLNWSKLLLEDREFSKIALFMKTLASLASTHPMEILLDYLIGSEQVTIADKITPNFCSPLREFYTSTETQVDNPDIMYQTIVQLTVLRSHLRNHQAIREDAFYLEDLIKFVSLYKDSGQRMVNTSPHHQQAESIQLMTVFKAKGLEFEHVFLIDVQDEVWGASSRASSNHLSLPANLNHIRHAGASEDERLRILFVAITRAKQGLYLTSFRQNFAGKPTKYLKYMSEVEQADGKFISLVLPENQQEIIADDRQVPDFALMTANWRDIHSQALSQTKLRDLLRPRLDSYKLSPTHLNTFIDLEYGGPQAFLLGTLLRFPQAPSSSGQFGNAIHETLQWLQYQVDETGKQSLPNINSIIQYFTAALKSKKLSETETAQLLERGKHALSKYIEARGNSFKPGDKVEVDFSNENTFIGKAQLAGKIDKLIIDHDNKTLTIVDYKTGRPYAKWESSLKLHKYKQQLYIYKMLLESSPKWSNYTVVGERLDFIEPDSHGAVHSLELKFNQAEFTTTKQLIEAMWHRVMTLDLPSVNQFSADYRGSRQFEKYLIDNTKI